MKIIRDSAGVAGLDEENTLKAILNLNCFEVLLETKLDANYDLCPVRPDFIYSHDLHLLPVSRCHGPRDLQTASGFKRGWE